MANQNNNDPEDDWFEFTAVYAARLSAAQGNWDTLSPWEQELAALFKLETDMYNGGFIQFFCNWGYDCYTHAIRCLERLKAFEALAIISDQYKIIQRLEDDNRVQELWDIPGLLTDDEIDALEALDKRYWNNSDNIELKTLEVYKIN